MKPSNRAADPSRANTIRLEPESFGTQSSSWLVLRVAMRIAAKRHDLPAMERVFGNESAMIAELFADALLRPSDGCVFDEVVFAILDSTEDKAVFERFRQTLQQDPTG